MNPHLRRAGRYLADWLRSRVVLIAFAFCSYFICVGLYSRAWEWAGCGGEQPTGYATALVLYVATVGLALFAAPIVRTLRREVDGERASWPTGLAAVGKGIVNVVFCVALVQALAFIDKASTAVAPETAHTTDSAMANRVLDLWSIGACAVRPSGECNVLFSTKRVPLRSWLAHRACESGAQDTYGLCRIALEEGKISQYDFCRRDAQMPLDQSVCSFEVRAHHRRELGLIVQGRVYR